MTKAKPKEKPEEVMVEGDAIVVEDHDRAMHEATMTKEQALEWARKQIEWPARRFRVEGTKAGPSRLVHRDTAQKIVHQYGGKMVELIHPWKREYALRQQKIAKHVAKAKKAARRKKVQDRARAARQAVEAD